MNKYEIIGIVGEGAYGVVYKAKCKESGEFGKSWGEIKGMERCKTWSRGDLGENIKYETIKQTFSQSWKKIWDWILVYITILQTLLELSLNF